MIIVRAPYRVSLIGGSSDLKPYLDKYKKGVCLGFAIDKYSYVSVQKLAPYHDYKSRIIYSKVETVQKNEDIEHKTIWYTLNELDMMDWPLEIIHFSEIPGNSGLATSSAFLCSLIKALLTLKNENISNVDLIKKATEIENIYSYSGFQDASYSSVGGLASFLFTKNNNEYSIDINDFWDSWAPKQFEQYGLLFHLKEYRNSSSMLESYMNSPEVLEKSNQLSKLAEDAVSLLNSQRFTKFCEILNKGWQIKKEMSSNILTKKVIGIEHNLNRIGIMTFRMLGSGGGGSIFILAHPNKHQSIIDFCLSQDCIHIPFRIPNRGCDIIEW